MRSLLTVAVMEWRRFFRERVSMFSTILLPVVLVLLIGLSFGGGGGKVSVGLLPESPGPLGTSLIEQLEQSPGIQVAQYTQAQDLYRDIRMGVVAGGVAVPPDGQPVAIYVQQTSTDAGVVMTQVNAAAAAVGTTAIATDVLAAEVPRKQAEKAVAKAQRDVPAVEVTTRTVGQVQPSEQNAYATAVPSQLMLFTFLNGLLGAAALVAARQFGVFNRTLAMPRGLGTYIGGLGLSRVAIALLQAVILLGLGRWWFGVDFGDPLAVAVLVFVYAVIAAAAGMLLGGLARSTGQAVAIAVPLGIVLGMLGGTMWPLSVVGPVMRWIGHLTPQAWAMDAWNLIINDGAGVAGIAVPLMVLVGFAVVLSVLAVWAVGRHARGAR